MKRVVLAAVFAVAAGVAGADPLEGIWRTAPDDNGNSGHVQIVPCGSALCGTLIKSFDSAGKPMASENIGKLIIWDMVANGASGYKGMLWSPDRDKTYKSKLTLSGNTLAVEGCIAFLCRNGGTWTRAN
ncbi:DUF2147 domain-containing protein [Phaeovulum sp.]|uniref:DUF2147 domain-containing protein n=1 Tax=Phaeovulum sp. TaxID=2934796 RepID=UPI002730FB23|nr:DUF2147 domain-containing protein [Phaeovulum sp.]MDP1668652.1 DUF2147 domain-containing protein [Phaeovulum sp.]MDP2061580.1 DUF2147 domain-containing protein [Phaeovulum sp.]MDZ4119860.1 DUF2147 domain-containing protein [Phaeovulum sp.]